MKRLSGSINLSSLALVVALSIFIGYQVSARPGMLQRPTSVATVNLSRVLEGLQQRADAEVGLKTMENEISAARDQRENDLKQQSDRIKELTGADRMAAEEKFALDTLNYQAWIQFVNDKLDVERALLLQDLYRTIRNSIEEMAETQGYDLVVVDDSRGETRWSDEVRLSREAQTLQQIRGRRVLYGSPVVDISDDLVARMNNAHRIGN